MSKVLIIAEHDGSDTARARELVEVMNAVEVSEFSNDLWGDAGRSSCSTA